MPAYQITKTIHAPRQYVFELCTDLERWADLIEGIKSIELLTEGPMRIGTRFRETRIMFGKPATEQFEMTAWDPPQQFEMVSESCGARYQVTHRFIEHAEGTRLELEMRITAQTLFARLMSPLGALMAGPMKKAIDRDLEDLKAAAECAAPQPAV